MKSENRLYILRAGYWIGAIMDGIYSLNVCMVWLFGTSAGFDPIRLVRFTEGLQSQYAWGMVLAIMLSWTILLVWADRKPIERRDVILLTAYPLVSLLLADTFFALSVGIVTWIEIFAVQVAYVFLIVLFTLGYFLTRTMTQE